MAETRKPGKVLIIDPDESLGNQVEGILSSHQIPCKKANEFSKGVYFYNNERTDLCIISKMVDTIPASILIQKFRSHEMASKCNPAFIILSQSAADRDLAYFRELGGIVVLAKPVKEPTLLSGIAKAMEEAIGREQLLKLRHEVIDPLLKKKDFASAVKIAEEKLLKGGPKHRFYASEIMELTEDFRKSLDITSELHKKDERNIQYINQLGRLNLKLGELSAAQKFYEKADELAPNHLERMAQMAELYLEMRLPDKSIEKYRKLIEFNPEKPDLKFEFFEALQKRGFEKEAISFCKENTGALELIRHYNNKGVMFSRAGEHVKAIKEYDKARRLIPKSKETYRVLYNMAIAHINQKTHAHLLEAEALLQESLKIKPDYEKGREKLELVQKHIRKQQAAG